MKEKAMGEIGLGQFMKNVFDYSTGKPVQQQPGKVANENFQKAQNEVVKAINQTVKNIAENFVKQHDIMNTQMQLKDLSNAERSMLMKNLFDFPSDMKDLVKFLIADGRNNLTAKQINQLMSQNLDLSKLLVLLQNNGKGAMDKIQKLITTMNQSGIYETRQLKEMAILVNACIPASDASSSQILKSVMIMYLPWLPLSETSSFDIGSNADNDGKSNASDDIITIIITTKNFGQVKILIFKEDSGFNMDINCSSEFPKEKLTASLAEEGATAGMHERVVYNTRQATDEDKSDSAKIDFSKSANISPQLMIVIHSVIKQVMEIDQNASLVQGRKESL